MQHNADFAAQRLTRIGGEIAAINSNRATLRLVQAQQQAHQGRFSGTRGTDQRHALAGPNMQRHVIEYRRRVLVAKGDMIEGNLTLEISRFHRVGNITDIRLNGEHVANAFGTYSGTREFRPNLSEILDRTVKVIDIGDEHQ